MSQKLDIVVQGGIWPSTNRILYYYKSLPFVNNVILSSWHGEKYLDTIDYTGPVILNDYPECRGVGNINLQILSSQYGLAECTADYAVKVRTDWKIYEDYWEREWSDFLIRHSQAPEIQYLDEEGTAKPMFISALVHSLPYHPQDHIVLGRTEDNIKYWDMPLLDEDPPGVGYEYGDHHQQADKGVDWSKTIRNPIWFGINWAARFSKTAKHHLENINEYCVDDAPKMNEALREWDRVRDAIFQPLRKPDIWWEKTPDKKYPMHWTEAYDHYYNNEYIHRDIRVVRTR